MKPTKSIFLFITVIIVSGCAQYDKAVEKLDWLEPDTFTCDVVQVKSADSFFCKFPDLQIDNIKLAGIKIIPGKESQSRDFLETVLKRDTLVNIEPHTEANGHVSGTVSYVWVPGGKMLNLVLVQRGYADIDPETVNERYETLFIKTKSRAGGRDKQTQDIEVIEEVEIKKGAP